MILVCEVCKFLFFHFLLIRMLQEIAASIPNSLKMLILVSTETLHSICTIVHGRLKGTATVDKSHVD